MENVFLTQYFDWNYPQSGKIRWVNSLMARFGFRSRLVSSHSSGEQTSIEQRINLFHLASEVLVHDIQGSFAEIGCYRGSTAALLQKVIDQNAGNRQLHVYDAFLSSSKDDLIQNLQALELRVPIIHIGRFEETLPSQLPDLIAFAHIDANWGQKFENHQSLVLHCLRCVYPRMAPGAICVIADYCEADVFSRQGFAPPWTVTTSRHWDQYPAVKAACDQFLAGKPEKMSYLYGGAYSHGFFRKSNKVETLPASA